MNNNNNNNKPTMLITGATAGIGLALLNEVCDKYNVTITARSQEKAEDTFQLLKEKHPNVTIDTLILDLLDTTSIMEAKKVLAARSSYDVVVLNAGCMHPKESRSKDGLETCYHANFLGHHMLLENILELKPKEHHMKVVILSSVLLKMIWAVPKEKKWYKLTRKMSQGTSGFSDYARSKLAITTLPYIFPAENVTYVAVHPGNSVTNLNSNIPPTLRKVLSIFKSTLIPVEASMQNVVQAINTPSSDKPRYFHASVEQPYPKMAQNKKFLQVLEKRAREDVTYLINKYTV